MVVLIGWPNCRAIVAVPFRIPNSGHTAPVFIVAVADIV